MRSAWRKGRGKFSSSRTSNTISIRGVEPINYDDDVAYDDDYDDDDNFSDDNDDDDVFSSSQLIPNTIGTRGGSKL